MKRVIYLFTGISAFLLMFFASVQKTSAISYDPNNSGLATIKSIQCIYSGGLKEATRDGDMLLCDSYQLGSGVIIFDRTVKKNSVLTLYVENYVNLGNGFFAKVPALVFSHNSTVISESTTPVESVQDSKNVYFNDSISGQISYTLHYYQVYQVLITSDTDRIQFNGISGTPSFFLYFFNRVSYVMQSDTASSVNTQTQQQKEQFEKEQQQREEDQKKADDAKNNSESSSEDLQSQADDASASLFEVINSLKDTIIKSEPGNCNISGDFGFFNAGTIDICTGGAAFKPITSVVGTVMMLFFTFGSAMTLFYTFMKLYNESMGT